MLTAYYTPDPIVLLDLNHLTNKT